MRAQMPRRPGIQVLAGDASALPLPDSAADGAWLSLVIHHIPDLEAAPLILGDSSGMVIGDKIFVVSNPQDLEGTFSEGIVSGKRKLENVLLSPHIAHVSDEAYATMRERVCDDVVTFFSGKWPPLVANPEVTDKVRPGPVS